MPIFFNLLQKLIPLYSFIALGFIAARRLNIQRETIGNLLLYVISPLVFFNSIARLDFEARYLLLPLSTYFMGSLIALIFYKLGAYVWKDSTRNILAFTSGTGNTGYFGIPVIMMLFGEAAVGYTVMCVIGYVLYENTIGYYLTARGQYSVAESLRRVVKLPTLYAFVVGLIFSFFKITIPATFGDVFTFVRGTYSVLGMIIIGVSLSSLQARFDWKFMSAAFFAKFVVWPALTALLITLDNNLLHLFDANIHRILLVISCTPLAANTVVLAALLKAEPEKAALAVLASTLAALFYIPIFVALFI